MGRDYTATSKDGVTIFCRREKSIYSIDRALSTFITIPFPQEICLGLPAKSASTRPVAQGDRADNTLMRNDIKPKPF